MLIAADRRRKNIGELYKPTVPRIRNNTDIPSNNTCTEKGFVTCSARRSVILVGIQKVGKYSLLSLITELGLLETICHAPLLM